MARDRVVKLVRHQKNGDFFWTIIVKKNQKSVSAGRVGSGGHALPATSHANSTEAHSYANNLIDKKQQQGYEVMSKSRHQANDTQEMIDDFDDGAPSVGGKRRGGDAFEDDDTDSVASTASLIDATKGFYGKRRRVLLNDSDHDTDSIASTDSVKARRGRWHGVSPLNRRRSLRLAEKNGEAPMETGWCPPIDLLTRQSTTADLRKMMGLASLQSQSTVVMSDRAAAPATLQRMETSGKWSGWRNKPGLSQQDTIVSPLQGLSRKPSRLSKRLSTKMETISEHSIPLKPSLLKKTSTTTALRKNLASTKLETLKTMETDGLIVKSTLTKSKTRKLRFNTDVSKSVFESFSFRDTNPSTSDAGSSEVSKRGMKRKAGSHAHEQNPKTPDATPDYSLKNGGVAVNSAKGRHKLLQRQSSLAVPKGVVHCPPVNQWPVDMLGQVVWQVPLTTHGMAVHVDDSRCFIGDESGSIIQLDAMVTPVNVTHLASGVKCLVEDDGFIYAACNDSQIYDVTHGDARCVSHIQEFDELYAMDVCEGVVAISDACGNVASVSHKGEIVWQRKSGGEFGWMVFVDSNGIYHGHSAGVTKYSLKGDLMWHLSIKDGVISGVQTEDYLYAASGAKVLKICKESGNLLKTFDKGKSHSRNLHSVTVGSGVVFAGGHKIVVYDEATGDIIFIASHSFTPASMKYFSGRLFCVGKDTMCVLDFCEETVKNAMAGVNVNTVDVQVPASLRTPKLKRQSTVVQSQPPRDGILVECVKGKGRKGALKVKTYSVGFNKQWDVQFPAELCEEGSKFIVKELKPCTTGHYYRVNGPIYEASE